MLQTFRQNVARTAKPSTQWASLANGARCTFSVPGRKFSSESKPGKSNRRKRRTTQRVSSVHGTHSSKLGNSLALSFLGTGSVSPRPGRAAPSLALRLSEEVWMFDCGENTQYQFQRSATTMSNMKRIFITHLHGDHFFGLPGLLSMVFVSKNAKLEKKGKGRLRGSGKKVKETAAIEIYGPRGLRAMLRAMSFYTASTFCPYVVHELHDIPHLHPNQSIRSSAAHRVMADEFVPEFTNRHGGKKPTSNPLGRGEISQGNNFYPNEDGVYELFNTDAFTVSAAPLSHTTYCVGYVVKEHGRPGRLNAEKVLPILSRNFDLLKEAGHRDPRNVLSSFKSMERDETYTFPNGESVLIADVVGADHPGRKIAVFGDCCDASDGMKKIANDCDVLVHEATDCESRGDSSTAYFRGHSNPEMAGKMAKEVNAKCVFLNHFGSRASFPGLREYPKFESRVKRKAAQFSHLSEDDVYLSHDLQEVAISAKHSDEKGTDEIVQVISHELPHWQQKKFEAEFFEENK